MPKREWEVVRPWFGVSAGQRFSADTIHPSLRNNVRRVPEPVVGELTTSVAEPTKPTNDDAKSVDKVSDQQGGGQDGVGKQQSRNRRQRN